MKNEDENKIVVATLVVAPVKDVNDGDVANNKINIDERAVFNGNMAYHVDDRADTRPLYNTEQVASLSFIEN